MLYKGIIHLQQKHASIFCNPKEAYISLECLASADSKEYRATFENLITVIQNTRLNKAIFDLSKLNFIAIKDQYWIANDWLPRAMEAGLLNTAIITSDQSANQKSVEDLLKMIQLKEISFEIRKFNQKEAATIWITQSA